jgi:hypothetical protein
MKETLISSFGFLEQDRRWGGAVEVLRVERADGLPSVDLRLRVGTRTLSLPRRAKNEIIAALTGAYKRAGQEYRQLVIEMNKGDG